jgi:alpha-L-rhamnosidase
LALELVPAAARNRAENALLKQIEVGRGHIGSGFVATPYVLQVLSDVAPEVGHQITTAQDAPSWYAMTAGSDHDLMQEAWNGRPAMMPSLGGNIAMWNMQSLGGIRPDPFGPGFKKFLIRPNIVGDLHWVECWFDSVYGRITSNWRRREDELVMDVTVPVNTTATIYVPATHTSAVSANGRPATDAPGVKHLRLEGGRLVLAVESGTFRFKTALPPTTPPNTP